MPFTKCPVCGSELTDDMTGCEKCGWTAEEINSEEAAENAEIKEDAVKTLQKACSSDSEAQTEQETEAAASKKSFGRKKTAPSGIKGKAGGAFYGFLKSFLHISAEKKNLLRSLSLRGVQPE